jgi:PKD repeat protein
MLTFLLTFLLTLSLAYAGPGDIPVIHHVSSPKVLYSETSLPLTVCDIQDTDGIIRVWAEICPQDGNCYEQALVKKASGAASENCFKGVFSDFHDPGTTRISIYAMDVLGNVSYPKYWTVNKAPPVDKKAIIIAGPPENAQQQSVFQNNVSRVTQFLENQGFGSHQMIGLGEPSYLKNCLPLSASGMNDALAQVAFVSDVFVYLTGFASNGHLKGKLGHIITDLQIMTWLNQIHKVIDGHLIVITDMTDPGHCLNLNLNAYAQKRIVITSTKHMGDSHFFADGSSVFTHLLFSQLSQGAMLGNAFEQSAQVLNWPELNQYPRMDANANARPNEQDDISMANQLAIFQNVSDMGTQPVIQAYDVPNIVTGDFIDITVTQISSSSPIVSVMAICLYPESNAFDRQIHSFSCSHVSSQTYACQISLPEIQGIYDIAILAMDQHGQLSSPVYSQFNRSGVLPDAYEPDNDFASSKRILLNTYDLSTHSQGTIHAQYHNFHHANDVDWVKMYCQKDQWYSLDVEPIGKNCDYVIRMYNADGERFIKTDTPVPDFDLPYSDRRETAQWQASDEGFYYAKINQCGPSDYPAETDVCEEQRVGADTEYKLTFFLPYLNFPNLLSGKIFPATANPIIKLYLGMEKIFNAEIFSTGSNLRFSIGTSANNGDPIRLVAEADGFQRFEEAITFEPLVSKNTMEHDIHFSTVKPPPLADFTAEPVSGPAPLVVSFKDTSQNLVDTRIWDFGDQYTQTVKNPTHIYENPGTYTVQLSVLGPGGPDTKILRDLIHVSPAVPVADFSFTPDSGIAPLPVKFTDLSQHAVTQWAWEFSTGDTRHEQSPTYTFNDAGTYSVTLTVWGPGGSHHECKNQIITVEWPPPVASFSAYPITGTAPLQVQFIDESKRKITSYEWSFGDGSATVTEASPIHTFTVPGTYEISLKVSGPGGSDTNRLATPIVVSPYIAPKPQASFTAIDKTGQVPHTVQFTAHTSGEISHYEWHFGDGTTSDQQNPKHEYQTYGTFDVSLEVTGPGGTVRVFEPAYILVTPEAPIANFDMSPIVGTAPLAVHFTDTSAGVISHRLWYVDHQQFSQGIYPHYVFKKPGEYQVRLTVQGPGGSDSKEGVISVNYPPPRAYFAAHPDHGVVPLTVVMKNLSDGEISKYLWRFGDQQTSIDQEVSHTYTFPGEYTAELIVTGPGGTASWHQRIIVEPEPLQADFTASNIKGIAPLPVRFTDRSQGDICQWRWLFGDGQGSNKPNPLHSYQTPGKYDVTLTVSCQNRFHTKHVEELITVDHPEPVANFTVSPKNGQAPLTVQFMDRSIGTIDHWLWDFGDGQNLADVQHPSHEYAYSATPYDVTLTVQGPGGEDTYTYPSCIVMEKQPLHAEFSAQLTQGPAPLTVNFTDLSTGPIQGWHWEFGDNQSAWESNPTHVYQTKGIYTVSLTINDGSEEASKTRSQMIHVEEPAPVANFLPSNARGKGTLTVPFTDQSTGEITQWLWSFGDGSHITQQHPIHTFQEAGECHDVTLTVTGPGGMDTKVIQNHSCVDFIPPAASFTFSPKKGEAPLTVKFNNHSQHVIQDYLWSFGDGSQSTEFSPTHVYQNPGIYTVSLSVRGPGGHDTYISSQCITVSEPLQARFDASPLRGKVPLMVEFKNISQGEIDQCLWHFGDGKTSSDCHPAHLYEIPDTYTVSLTISNASGSQTVSQENMIQVLPDTQATAPMLYERQWPRKSDYSWGRPQIMAMNGQNNLLVLDWLYGALYRFDTEKADAYEMIHGTLKNPSGMVVSQDAIFVSNTGKHCIKKLTLTGEVIQTWGHRGSNPTEFYWPHGMAIDNNNQLYVADTGNGRIQVFALDGTFIKVHPGASLQLPTHLVFTPDNHLCILDIGQSKVVIIDSQGLVLAEFQAPDISAIAMLNQHTLLMLNQNTHAIQWIDINTGQQTANIGQYGQDIGSFKQAGGLLALSQDSFLVADSGNRRIQKWENNHFSLFAGPKVHDINTVHMLSSLSVDDDANMYVTDYLKNRIQIFSRTGSLIKQWGKQGQGPEEFNGPLSVHWHDSAHVYVVDFGNHRIQCFDHLGRYQFQWGSEGDAPGRLNYPTHLTTDASGDLYVVDTFNHRIQKFSSDGLYINSWGQLGSYAGQFRYPLDIACDGKSRLFITDFGNNRIQIFDLQGRYLEHLKIREKRYPMFMAYNLLNASLHGIQYMPGNHWEIDTPEVQMHPMSIFQYPIDITTDISGRIYILDAHANRIKTFRRLYPKDIRNHLKIFTNMPTPSIQTFWPDHNNDGKTDFLFDWNGR